MWSRINQSPGNSKSSVTTTGILTYCKLFFTFQSITSFELCYQTRLDPTGKGLSAKERLDLGPRGWDWARTGPGWSRFKQKCANFSLTSKPVSVPSLDIFSTARDFETRGFSNGFIVGPSGGPCIDSTRLTFRAQRCCKYLSIYCPYSQDLKAVMSSLCSTMNYFTEL